MSGFGGLIDDRGGSLSIGDLAPAQVYISGDLADKLDAGKGETIDLYLGNQRSQYEVAGTYRKGAHPAGKLSIVMPLSRLQALTGNEGKITAVIITNRGDAIAGAEHTSAVVDPLETALEETGLEVEPIKQKALERAEENGTELSNVFFVFAQFSVAAGILLIFLMFVMMAAERKRELGISRAVGTQRRPGHDRTGLPKASAVADAV